MITRTTSIKWDHIFIYFLFFITIVLTLNPFFKIGFTTADDLENYMSVLSGNVFSDAKWYAQGAGRFYFLITKPIYHLPYLIDNFYFTKIVQYSSLLLSFVLFALVIKKIFKQKYFSLLVFLMLFVFLTVMPNYHVPVQAYPFYFTFSFSIILFSILRLIKYTETDKYKYLIQSVILFAVALLFYETYLVFLLILCIFIFCRNVGIYKKNILKTKTFYKEILPFVIVAVVYVLIYFGYRELAIKSDEFYSGSSFSNDINIKNVLKILINYNNVAYPKFVYNTHQSVIEANSLLESGHQKGFFYILANSQIEVIINALMQCFIFVFLFTKIKPNITWKKIGLSILFSFLLMLSVHLILSFSEKYNSEYWLGVNGYVTTYYSYFMVVLILGLVMLLFLKLCYKKLWLRSIVIGVFSLVLFYFSIIIGYNNEHISRDWEHSHNQFAAMDELCIKGAFDNIPENSVIFAEDLYKSVSMTGKDIYNGFKWDDYVFLKANKKISFCENPEEFIVKAGINNQQDIYYISKYETIKSNDILYALTKINRSTIDYTAPESMFLNAVGNSADIHYYSVNKDFTFEFVIPDAEELPVVTINNKEQITGRPGINVINITNRDRTDKITSLNVHSNEPFHVNNFLLSTIGNIKPHGHQVSLH